MANAAQTPKLPRMLEGYRVLDFTQYVAGPTCSRLMAEMGAEVVKLELAPGGDRIRDWGFKPRNDKAQQPQHLLHATRSQQTQLCDRHEAAGSARAGDVRCCRSSTCWSRISRRA